MWSASSYWIRKLPFLYVAPIMNVIENNKKYLCAYNLVLSQIMCTVLFHIHLHYQFHNKTVIYEKGVQ